jgi:Tfp pilus assembly protein PilF
MNSDRLDTERELAAEISYKLGAYLEEREGNNKDSITAYNDCLSRNENHKESLIALARLFQNIGENDHCTQYCQRLLKIDASNE